MKKQAGISKGARAATAAEAEALARAVAAAEGGNMGEAERIARVVLAQKPQHLEALQLLGALLMAQKRPREAIVPLEDAACRSANPELETYLAIALRVGDGMGLDVDPRRERCVLRLDRRLRRATLAHVGGHELCIHARRVDDGKAADERDDDETPRPGRHAPSPGKPSRGHELGAFHRTRHSNHGRGRPWKEHDHAPH